MRRLHVRAAAVQQRATHTHTHSTKRYMIPTSVAPKNLAGTCTRAKSCRTNTATSSVSRKKEGGGVNIGSLIISARAGAGAVLTRPNTGDSGISTRLRLFHTTKAVKTGNCSREEHDGPEVAYKYSIGAPAGSMIYKTDFEVEGGPISGMEIAYETWGSLNRRKDNAILLHCGMSASSHARSTPENTTPGNKKEGKNAIQTKRQKKSSSNANLT